MPPSVTTPSADEQTKPSSLSLLSCGLVSGFLQAGLFNPWDRALYLSIKENRPFLSMDNFRHPWSGVLQTIVQRALSAGLYFPLEEIYSAQLRASFTSSEEQYRTRRPLLTFASGILSGITSGVIMNPISAVKYHYWGTPTGKENFLTTASDMMKQGGLRIFIGGSWVGIGLGAGIGVAAGVTAGAGVGAAYWVGVITLTLTLIFG